MSYLEKHKIENEKWKKHFKTALQNGDKDAIGLKRVLKSYDRHPQGEDMEMFDFSFDFSKYQLWQGGKIISKDDFEGSILADVVNTNNEHNTKITIKNNNIPFIIASEIMFEVLRSGTDRMQLIHIPLLDLLEPDEFKPKELGHNIIDVAMAMPYPNNQPFCCNIFTKDSKIVKITFSYVGPQRLLEFTNLEGFFHRN